MAEEPGAAMARIAQHTEHDVVFMLREAYPYMKIDTVRSIAAGCKELIQSRVEANLPLLQATVGRISFLSLSAELRNRIYELVLVRGKGHRIVDNDVRVKYMISDGIDLRGGKTMKPTYRNEQPAITRVSRQIRQETLPIFYGANQFVIYMNIRSHERHDIVSVPGATAWFETIGPQNFKMLKSLVLYYGEYRGRKWKNLAPASRFVALMALEGFEVAEAVVAAHRWVVQKGSICYNAVADGKGEWKLDGVEGGDDPTRVWMI